MPIIVQVILVLICAGLLAYLINLIGLPKPYPQLINIVILVGCIFGLVGWFWPHWRFFR